MEGALRKPGAANSRFAVNGPWEVSSRQSPAASSHCAAVTSQPRWMCSRTPNRCAHLRRYSRISGCSGYVRVQFGLSANENE